MPQQNSGIGGKKLELKSIKRAAMVISKQSELPKDTATVNFLKGLPSMIKQNGLAQTLLFLKIKQEKIYTLLNAVVLPNKDLLGEALTLQSSKEYIDLQREALEYAAWIKQFALAFEADKPAQQTPGGTI